MSGGLNYEYAERLLKSKYGDTIYTNALFEVMPIIEDLELDHKERGRDKPKK